jgi:hypothetical protein
VQFRRNGRKKTRGLISPTLKVEALRPKSGKYKALPVPNAGIILGQKLVEIPFEGSSKAMAQSGASNVTPMHRGGILPAGAVAQISRCT